MRLFQMMLEAKLSDYPLIYLKDGSPALVLHETGVHLYVLKKDPVFIKVENLRPGDLIAVEKWGELRPAKVLSRPANPMMLPTGEVIARAGGPPRETYKAINRPSGEWKFRVELLDNKEKMQIAKRAREGMPKMSVINKAQFKRMA